MKPTIEKKLQQYTERYEELGRLLNSTDILKDPNRLRDLSKEYAQMTPLVNCFRDYQTVAKQEQEAQDLLNDASSHADLKRLAEEESQTLKKRLEELEKQLQQLMLPQDPNDQRNVFVEIRAGTGGDEAALFVGDLLKMYLRYAEKQHWQVEIINQSEGEYGGYREIILRISGKGVYSRLKFESGVHRVQRVPKTEAQGRIHTSTCTVAVMPEVEAIDSITINPADLRIDTFRASGAGGQHVNRTDSAVRITHIPTGVVVECQAERSQHQNKARAMSLLQSRLLEAEQEKQEKEQVQKRRSLIGTGDRSERIRTYNFPQKRITDHRINLSLYQLPQILEGDLDPLINPLIQENQAKLLAQSEG